MKKAKGGKNGRSFLHPASPREFSRDLGRHAVLYWEHGRALVRDKALVFPAFPGQQQGWSWRSSSHDPHKATIACWIAWHDIKAITELSQKALPRRRDQCKHPVCQWKNGSEERTRLWYQAAPCSMPGWPAMGAWTFVFSSENWWL